MNQTKKEMNSNTDMIPGLLAGVPLLFAVWTAYPLSTTALAPRDPATTPDTAVTLPAPFTPEFTIGFDGVMNAL